jgi:hypothetical protein
MAGTIAGWPPSHPRLARYGFRRDQAFPNRALQPRLKSLAYDRGGRRRAGASLALSDHAALLLDLSD